MLMTFLPDIRKWFLQKKDHFEIFADADSRLEGWFKAELLVLLTNLKEQGHLDEFEREAKILSPKDGKRKQIDFQLKHRGENHVCELKALCISRAAGTPRDLQFYFRDDHLGLVKDFKKLDELHTPNKWVLGFVYPSPKLETWNKAVESLPSELRHWQPVTKPQDFSDWMFISLWKG